MKVPRWAWVAWVVVGVLIEAVALGNGVANDTLTETLVALVPGWLVFMGIGWLIWHFIQSYQTRRGK